MNSTQANAILDIIIEIERFNIETRILENFPDSKDYSNTFIQDISIAEFLFYTKQINSCFKDILSKKEIFYLLSYNYNLPEIGQTNIEERYQVFFNTLKRGLITDLVPMLSWFNSYLNNNGINFLISNNNIQNYEESIGLLYEKLHIAKIDIDNSIITTKQIIAELEKTKVDIQQFVQIKNDELSTISNNLNNSTNQSNQIFELLNKSTELTSRLNTIIEQQEGNKLNFDKKIIDIEGLYTKTQGELAANIKEVQSRIDKFTADKELQEDHLKFIESKRSFFDERLNVLQNLIGLEVSHKLFQTFNERKKELRIPVIVWGVAVPLMAICTVAWISYLFSNHVPANNTQLWWEGFAINSLKSIPAIFLLFFTINQYRKERNFQEEYAFKSAVALTIDAYAGRLNDHSNRDKLIVDSVNGIYRTPIEEKQNNLDKINSKTILENLKLFTESVKDLTGAIKK